MSNRITYNRIKKRHLLTPIFFYWLSYFLSPILCANTLFINVYLKINTENQIALLIKNFNTTLKQQQIFKTYNIRPFLSYRPLHITLYLSHYKEKYRSELISRVKKLAQQEKPLDLSSDTFQTNGTAYVMLKIKTSPELQQLSNTTVNLLMDIHDENAVIPAWAAQDAKRANLFKHYGSPSVLEFFNPHFSIMDPEYLAKEQQNKLVAQLEPLINQFKKTHHMERAAKAYALGVGVADEQGQIIDELASFSLGIN